MASTGGKNAMTKGKATPSSQPLKPAPKVKAKPKAKPAPHPIKSENGKRTGFQLGHQLWRLAERHGKKPGQKPLYAGPQELWDACVEYFDWIVANPLMEKRIINDKLDSDIVEVPKMRAMSFKSLCVFLDVAQDTWVFWRKNREDLKDVIEKVDAIIYDYKFTGAAAGLLNPGMMARELGLVDKREQTGAVQIIISGDDAEL